MNNPLSIVSLSISAVRKVRYRVKSFLFLSKEKCVEETSYLMRYPDVALAVKNGTFPSGRSHFQKHGIKEGRSWTAPAHPDIDQFDEAAYLRRYPDAARSVERKLFTSGYDHFFRMGFFEGRVGLKIGIVPERLMNPVDVIHRIPRNPTVTSFDPAAKSDNKVQDVSFFLLHDVIVAGRGLVFDARGHLFLETVHQNKTLDIEVASNLVRTFLKSQQPNAITDGTGLLCNMSGAQNYGHWLLELLPIAFVCRKFIEQGWFVLAPSFPVESRMNVVLDDSLALIGIGPAQVKKSSGLPQRYANLVVAVGMSQHGAHYSPHAIAAFDWMTSQVRGSATAKVWVARTTSSRRLAEEEKVCCELAKRGWVIAYPEEMCLRDQIALFKNASCIAGVNGAGLTNMAFARRGILVISFVPAGMPDVFYRVLSQSKGQSLIEIRCPQQNKSEIEFNWNCHLMLSAEDALRHIDEAMTREISLQ